MTPTERIRAVLDAEAAAIAGVVVTNVYEDVVDIIADRGRVITTGMGKAGLVARKFAATLRSTGTPSAFLHPGEAAHGDLGLLHGDEAIVVFSTSGQTDEVLEMLDSARRLYPSIAVIGITSHRDAPVRSRCVHVLDMGLIDEPCPLGLTPSASTAVMSAIGDALALAVLERKGITRQDFGARHRAGYLGQVAMR